MITRLTVDFFIGSCEVKSGFCAATRQMSPRFITNHCVQRVRAEMSTERYTHTLFSHFTFPPKKRDPTNCRLPALPEYGDHQYLGPLCVSVPIILEPRCAGGSLASSHSSGQQREDHDYRPRAQSDHRKV